METIKEKKLKNDTQEDTFSFKKFSFHLTTKALEGAAIGLGGLAVASIAKALSQPTFASGENVVNFQNRKAGNS